MSQAFILSMCVLQALLRGHCRGACGNQGLCIATIIIKAVQKLTNRLGTSWTEQPSILNSFSLFLIAANGISRYYIYAVKSSL